MLLVEIVLFYLVGGLEHDFYDFPYIGIFIIPTDELIFFRGVPPTRFMFCCLQPESLSSVNMMSNLTLKASNKKT